MSTTARHGGTPPLDVGPTTEVSRCLAAVWPLLLAASSAADGPNPATAAGPLRSAGELLIAAAARLN